MYLKTVHKQPWMYTVPLDWCLMSTTKKTLQYLTITSFFVWFFQSFPNSEEHAFLAIPMVLAPLNLILKKTNKQQKTTKKAKQLQLINKKKDVIYLQMQGNLYKQPQKYLISRSQDCFFCPAAFCQLQPYIYAHKLYRTTRELYGT